MEKLPTGINIVINADIKAAENAKIWEEIYYYQGKIDEYTEKICDYEAKRMELEDLHGSLCSLNTRFEERQQLRKEAVSEIMARQKNINMITDYAQDMEAFLNGSEYAEVCSGLKKAENRVNEKIRYFCEETAFCKSEINRCEEMISYWYARLK